MKTISPLLSFAITLGLLGQALMIQADTESFEGTTESSFMNPIFAGDYPDPSILRDEQDYYITHSSFEYYPGLLIWHSRDMVNWEPVCRALHKNVGSVWAPDFLKYGDTYYIYFPANGKNWVITAPSPEGPWSDPVRLDISHIDPGHIATPDGRRYLHMGGGWVTELSEDGLTPKGELVNSYQGWEIPNEWDVACMCLEGPKLIYRNGYYYLTSAEGGTIGPATAHMAVSARSKSPIGPWENSPYNPIVHTYSKSETWHAKGHGTILEDHHGQWWIVYHAYKKGFYTLGRQTLMEPIEWTPEGWFVVPDNIRTDQPIPKADILVQKKPWSLSDDFSGDTLGIQWSFFQNYEPERIRIADNTLHFETKGSNPSDSAPILIVPSDKSYEIQVHYEIHGTAKGGLVLFYNQNMYAGLVTDGEKFTIYRRGQPLKSGNNEIGRSGYLKIRNVENTITFHYSPDGQNWNKIVRSFVTEAYNHTAFGGFISLRTGLVSLGEGSMSYRDFVYRKIE